MPKPSGTNSPRASNTNSETRLYQGVSLSATYALPAETKAGRRYCGGNSSGDPPLPIPNREVKPARAYDTAIPSGQVGSRQFLRPSGSSDSDGLFFCPLAPRSCTLPSVAGLRLVIITWQSETFQMTCITKLCRKIKRGLVGRYFTLADPDGVFLYVQEIARHSIAQFYHDCRIEGRQGLSIL